MHHVVTVQMTQSSQLLGILIVIAFSPLEAAETSSGVDNNPALNVRKTCNHTKAVSERALRQHLWHDYSVEIRPVHDASSSIAVSLGLVLESVHKLDMKEREISLQGYLSISWQDDFLAWQGLPEFDCISLLVVPAKSVWLPDIALMKAAEKYSLFSTGGEKVRIFNDGHVQFRPGGLFSAGCSWDLTYFPYDEQNCSLIFQSWLTSNEEMSIQPELVPLSFHNWEENDEWELISYSTVSEVVDYFNPLHPCDSVKFNLKLRRRVGFFIMNVIIPATIISLVETSTWMLPAGEAVKLHISFTCLLAFGVFQLMVVPEMPMSSLDTPLLSIYICAEMAYIGLAIFGQGLVFALEQRAEKNSRISSFTMRICKTLAPMLSVRLPDALKNDTNFPRHLNGDTLQLLFPKKFKVPDEVLVMHPEVDYKTIYETSQKFPGLDFHELLRDHHKRAENSDDIRTRKKLKWHFVIRVVDRLFLTVYLFCIITTPIVLFMIVPGIALGMVRTLL